MRTLTTAQTTALAATDRTTHVRVKVEDPDGTLTDVSSLRGNDYLDQVVIEADVDNPISAATVTLWRQIGLDSLAPLHEASPINRDSSGSYAPFLNPNRQITVEVATMLQGQTPASGDWVLIFDGFVDEVEWGGNKSRVLLHCRDGMAQLNDLFIKTTGSYGNDSGTEDVEDVMQEILDDNFGSSVIVLTFAATGEPVREYELGNVTVLEALQKLADLIGWNLSWRWDSGNSAFRVTLWEPARTNTTAAYTFGQDDYYVIPRVGLNIDGVRNEGEVVYLTTSGTVATATDTRTDSQTLYSERFIRFDARGTYIVTATQADNLLSNILDDTEEPGIQQEIETAFFWPIELGDLYAFSANDHYDTEQKYGVFGYRHVLSQNVKRTVIQASGKASGGYARWHGLEGESQVEQNQERTPVVAAQVSQSGSTGLLDLTIHDPDFLVTNVQFAKKTDAGAYGSLATTWDRSTGTAGSNATLTRGEDVTLASKHSASIRYVVTYGADAVTIEGAHSFDSDQVAEVTNIVVTFNANGEAVVSATGDEDTANMYVTVGNGSAPSDPTSGANDGSISGRTGTVDTGVKITTGNVAYVKVIAYDSAPAAGPVASAQQARRVGQFHKDPSSRFVTGSTSETTLETITVPGGTLGLDGGIRASFHYSLAGTAGNKTIRVKWNGSTVYTFVADATYDGEAGWVDVLIFNNSSASSQRVSGFGLVEDPSGSGGQINVISVAGGGNTASDVDLIFTGQLSNGSDTILLGVSFAEYKGTD